MKTTKPFLSILTTLCVTSAAVRSQPAPPLSTNAGAFVHQITIEPGDQETRYRQIVSPVTLSIPIAMGSLNIQSAYMYLEEQTATGTRDASGPLDTQVSGEWNVGRSLFTGYVNIPTGSDSLDSVEADLARSMSRNDLNFPIKTFGQGLDVGGALTLAHQLNHWTISVGGDIDPAIVPAPVLQPIGLSANAAFGTNRTAVSIIEVIRIVVFLLLLIITLL